MDQDARHKTDTVGDGATDVEPRGAAAETAGDPGTAEGVASPQRRRALLRLGLAATAAYAAPTLLRIDRSAQATIAPTPCPPGPPWERPPGCHPGGGWDDDDDDGGWGDDDDDRWDD